MELDRGRLAATVLTRCRQEKVEPPSSGQADRVVASALRQFEADFCQRTMSRIGPAAQRLEDLVAVVDGARGGLLSELKADPGQASLDTLLAEVDKLTAVRELGLPADVFADASEKLLVAWRARAARSWPSDLRDAPLNVRLTLLAALCWTRQTEITDALVDLLISLVHKVNTRAERRVEREFTEDLRRVRGKEGILFRMAEAAVEHPDDSVRTALYPVVGEKTLRELVKEAKANQHAFQARVRTVLRSSYSNHYRRMLPALLAALELLGRYREVAGKIRFYDAGETVPVEGVVPKAWREAVVDGLDEKGRIERIPYELCVLVALRDALRRREVYVAGSERWRNPENDLPPDFEASRDVHYAELRQPLDPSEFIADLKQRMSAALDRFDTALTEGTAGGVRIIRRRGEPFITVPKLGPLETPQMLGALKEEIARR